MAIATSMVFVGGVPDAPARGYGREVLDAGGWCWFADPRAIHRDGVTYFGFVRGSDGSVVVAAYDHATKSVSSTVIASAFQANDHASPSVHIRGSDARIVVFYTSHLDSTVRYKVSTNPLDISAFGPEQTVANKVAGQYTYTYPVELPGDDLRLFYRNHVTADSGDTELHLSVWNGSAWAPAVRLHDLTYTKLAVHGDRIHFLVSGHPNTVQTSVYHFYFDLSANAYFTSAGVEIEASHPFQTSDLTLVYDGSTTRAWVWDIATDADGSPVAVFATFPGNDGSDHRYQYATWDGSAWDVNEIVAAGTRIPTNDLPQAEAFYSGGVVLDHADPSLVYASVKVGSQWHMRRYSTEDGGASWSHVDLDTGGKAVRPVAVRDSTPTLRALWMRGTYTNYLTYDVDTIGG